MTTLERQHRHRDRIKEKLARLERYEGALREIASWDEIGEDQGYCSLIARDALRDQTQ